MPGFEAIQSTIYTRFGAQWNFTTYPVVLEGQKWSLASFGSAQQPTTKAWGRFSVRFANAQDSSVDGKAKRVAGVAWLQIFLPEESGTMTASKMGDEMERIFGRKTIVGGGETVKFNRAVTEPQGKTDDGWLQFAATIGFISDAVTP